MHELAIDRNALDQLVHGVLPWTVVVPVGTDPLPFFTSRHIGRALYGYTLSPNGVWVPAIAGDDLFTHLVYTTGYVPRLDRDFQTNLDLLVHEIERPPENGLQRAGVGYRDRCLAWYRGITAFPRLYPTALEHIFVPDHL